MLFVSSNAGFGPSQSESGKCKERVGKEIANTNFYLSTGRLCVCPPPLHTHTHTHTHSHAQGRLESELAKTIDLVHVEK